MTKATKKLVFWGALGAVAYMFVKKGAENKALAAATVATPVAGVGDYFQVN